MFLSTKFVWMWKKLREFPSFLGVGLTAAKHEEKHTLVSWQTELEDRLQAGPEEETSIPESEGGNDPDQPGPNTERPRAEQPHGGGGGEQGQSTMERRREALVSGSVMKTSSLYLKTPLKMSNSEKTPIKGTNSLNAPSCFLIIFRHHSAPCPLPLLFAMISYCLVFVEAPDVQEQDTTLQILCSEVNRLHAYTEMWAAPQQIITLKPMLLWQVCHFQTAMPMLSGMIQTFLNSLKWGICECGCKERPWLTKQETAKLNKVMTLMHRIHSPLLLIQRHITRVVHGIIWSPITKYANTLTTL